MDIYREWEHLNKKIFSNQTLKSTEIMNAITSESKSTIHKIKQRLIIMSYWGLGFVILFSILMIISRKTPAALIPLGLLSLFYVVSFFKVKLAIRRFNLDFSEEDNILKYLESNADIVKRLLRFNFYAFGINAPIIILLTGFYEKLLMGHTLNSILNDSSFLVSQIFFCIIVLPLVYFYDKYLNKKSSLRLHLAKLNENINKLKGVEMIKDMVDLPK